MKLITHLQLVLRLRKRGSIHPLPHMLSWHSASLVKYRDNFTFYLTSYVIIVQIIHPDSFPVAARRK
jgi:hypothetical protein